MSGTQSSAASTGLSVSTSFPSDSKHSLSVGFNGAIGSFVTFQLSICPTMVKGLSAHIHFDGTYPSGVSTSLLTGSGAGVTGFSTGGDVNMSGTISPESVSFLQIFVTAPGAMGTVYLDNVRIN
jgi:hypothetical protein